MKLKIFLFLLPIIVLQNISFVSDKFSEIKSYIPYQDGLIFSEANLEYINKTNNIVYINNIDVNKEVINYKEILEWYKSKDSGICSYMIIHATSLKEWRKFCQN